MFMGDGGQSTTVVVFPGGELARNALAGRRHCRGSSRLRVLRVSYATFSRRFGVEPEEVGLGQTDILAQTGLGLVLVLLIGGFMVFIYVAAEQWAFGAGRQSHPACLSGVVR